jgi:membrane protease YdiL (CAAX protease family)
MSTNLPILPPLAPQEPAASEAARRLVRSAGVFYGILWVVALAWRWGWSGESLLYASPDAAARGVALGADLTLGLAAGALVIAVSWLCTAFTVWGERLSHQLATLVGTPTLAQVILLALASGIGEEAFFRGALQPKVGLVGASLVFALAHFVPRRELLPWTAFSLVAGFLLGGLFEWTGNLAAPIAAHVLINGVNLTLLTRR